MNLLRQGVDWLMKGSKGSIDEKMWLPQSAVFVPPQGKVQEHAGDEKPFSGSPSPHQYQSDTLIIPLKFHVFV